MKEREIMTSIIAIIPRDLRGKGIIAYMERPLAAMEIRREIMEAWKPRIKQTAEAILNGAEIVGRAVLFVVIVLAIELAVWGIVSLACGRW